MKKIILIIVAGVIVAGCIGGYFFFQKFQKQKASLRDGPTFDYETGKEMF